MIHHPLLSLISRHTMIIVKCINCRLSWLRCRVCMLQTMAPRCHNDARSRTVMRPCWDTPLMTTMTSSLFVQTAAFVVVIVEAVVVTWSSGAVVSCCYRVYWVVYGRGPRGYSWWSVARWQCVTVDIPTQETEEWRALFTPPQIRLISFLNTGN